LGEGKTTLVDDPLLISEVKKGGEVKGL